MATTREDTAAGRVYELPDGRRFPSVTSILRVVAKPALVSWAARVERQLVVEAATNLYDDLPAGATKLSRLAYTHNLLSRVGAQQAHDRALARAGDIGSEIHHRVEWALRRELGHPVSATPPPLSPPAAHAFVQWEQWRAAAALTPRMIEQTVWSSTSEYAGTLDLYGTLTLPDLGPCFTVLDWKSSRRIYPESGLQIAAYGAALCEMGHLAALPHGVIVKLPKTATDTLEVKILSPAEMHSHLDVFLAVVKLARWAQAQS